MNLPEDQDPLWDLLAKCPPPAPSPRFAARVARAVRELPLRGSMIRSFFTARPCRGWGLPAGLAAAAAVFALGLFLREDASLPPPRPSDLDHASAGSFDGVVSDWLFHDAADAFDPAIEIVAVEHLAQLMAVIDPDTLSDELFADLLF